MTKDTEPKDGAPAGVSDSMQLLGCTTGGLGCCAREAEEFEFVLGRICPNCSMVQTEWDDTVYICDPRKEKVSDAMTCNAFDAT